MSVTNETERAFHLGDILSITTGLLVSPRHMDGIYDILNWMSGDDLYTHQLGRATRECAPYLLMQHPALATVAPPDAGRRDAQGQWVAPWLAEQVARYGEKLPVRKVPPAKRVVRDPLVEVAEMVPAERIVLVQPERDDDDDQEHA